MPFVGRTPYAFTPPRASLALFRCRVYPFAIGCGRALPAFKRRCFSFFEPEPSPTPCRWPRLFRGRPDSSSRRGLDSFLCGSPACIYFGEKPKHLPPFLALLAEIDFRVAARSCHGRLISRLWRLCGSSRGSWIVISLPHAGGRRPVRAHQVFPLVTLSHNLFFFSRDYSTSKSLCSFVTLKPDVLLPCPFWGPPLPSNQSGPLAPHFFSVFYR